MAPLHLAAAVVSAAALLTNVAPLGDLDAPWHVAIGREILRRHSVHGLGTGWLAAPPPTHWVTSQWLAEVGMAAAVDAAGWRGLIVGKLLLATAVMAVLALTLLPRRRSVVAVPVYLLALVAVVWPVQERPQTISLIFLPLLGHAVAELFRRGTRPPLPVIAVLGLLWAQLHGLWILAPVGFVVAAAGLALDRRHPAARGALLAALASLTGLLNPHLAGSFLLPLRFRDSAVVVAEWRPTTITQPVSVAAALLLGAAVLAWARSAEPVPRAELLWIGTWTVFALLALRNVGPALLLVAPVVLLALERAGRTAPAATASRAGDEARRPSRESRVLAGLTATVLVATVPLAVLGTARTDPLAELPAHRIAGWFAGRATPLRVLNAYNASGSLIAFGGGRARLAIDPRADLWGADRIAAVVGIQTLVPGWRRTFAGIDPEAIVVPATAPLVQLLVAQGQWRVQLTDGEYQLLLPVRPGADRLP